MVLLKIFQNLPLDIIKKILLYAPIQPPHFLAWKTGIRIITSCELNCNLVSGVLTLDGGGRDENNINEEWFHYLIEQQYNIHIL